MPKKLTGSFNLSRIPKECIVTNRNGDKCVWLDITKKKMADGYGNTYTISIWDRNARTTVYLADLKEQEFGSREAQAQQAGADKAFRAPKETPAQPAEPKGGDDLPFNC